MNEQRWLRIIPVAFVMYTIAFVDRTNVSLALPSMCRDLHMDPAQAGAASGIFFVGYVLLQVPGGYLASRWSPKKLISILLVAWGLCSAATGFVHTWGGFLCVRFLLGLAEGGVWPAALVLVARWFPPSERARANAYWMLCLPAAVVFFSPLSGWILGRWNWRVLLVSEGLLPVVWLVIWVTQIVDYPRQARWLSPAERDYLEGALRGQPTDSTPVEKESFLVSLVRPQVLAMMAISFLVSAGNYAYLFWLPTILETSKLAGGTPSSHFRIGVLNAFPYIAAAVGMILVSRHSDRHRERALHVAACMAWAGLLLLASIPFSRRSPVFSFFLLCLVAGGSYGMLGPFWAIPTETLPAATAGSAIGLIQFSNLGGAFGPTLIGYLEKRTGGFTGAFALLGVGWLAAAGLCLLLRPRHRLTS
jgi:MFS family permease